MLLCVNILQDPSKVFHRRNAHSLFIENLIWIHPMTELSAILSPFHVLIFFGESAYPYRIFVWPICLHFLLYFLLVHLYASIRMPSKGTCAKPLNCVKKQWSLLSPLRKRRPFQLIQYIRNIRVSCIVYSFVESCSSTLHFLNCIIVVPLVWVLDSGAILH